MENRKYLITTGILGIAFTLAVTALPFGTGILQIINLGVFFLGIVAVALIAFLKKSDKLFMISSLIYAALVFCLTTVVEETTAVDFYVAIGFIPCLVIGICGIIRTRLTCKSKASYIINALAVLTALAAVALAFVAGWKVTK